MAKIGLEIEGVYNLGESTLFVSADEWKNKIGGIRKVLNSGLVSHIYISDHNGELVLDDVDEFMRAEHAEIEVTIEVTQLRETPPNRIRIMFNANNKTSLEIIATNGFLRESYDQIKFEFELNCLVAPVESFSITEPYQFENDIEITL